MTMHRFYAPPQAYRDGLVTLGESEAHHLRDVLRHVQGDEVKVFDGIGGEFRCRIDSMTKRSAELVVLAASTPIAESPLRLTLAAALLKGEKFDLIVKKCVELGVAAIIPLITDRCDVRVKDTAKRVERWEKLAIDASRQCGRATLMTIGEPVQFSNFVQYGLEERCILFSECGGHALEQADQPTEMTAIIGPEGGWGDGEIVLARERRVEIVTLGGRILRAETASITIAAILQNRFGDIN
jgi:16S rRNA (uracil1498-N3)-methyltransferase